MEESITTTIVFIGSLATFITSVMIIWNFVKKLRASLNSTVVETLTSKLNDNNRLTDEKIKNAMNTTKEQITHSLNKLEDKLDLFIISQSNEHKETNSTVMLLKSAIIESYKQDIRDIYYKLRETGELSDAAKAYTDKIFPIYKAAGGNSDIGPKYLEMCRVYERRTQEKFDEAFKNKENRLKTLHKTTDEDNHAAN